MKRGNKRALRRVLDEAVLSPVLPKLACAEERKQAKGHDCHVIAGVLQALRGYLGIAPRALTDITDITDITDWINDKHDLDWLNYDFYSPVR